MNAALKHVAIESELGRHMHWLPNPDSSTFVELMKIENQATGDDGEKIREDLQRSQENSDESDMNDSMEEDEEFGMESHHRLLQPALATDAKPIVYSSSSLRIWFHELYRIFHAIVSSVVCGISMFEIKVEKLCYFATIHDELSPKNTYIAYPSLCQRSQGRQFTTSHERSSM